MNESTVLTETTILAWLLGLLGSVFLLLLGVISWIVREHLRVDLEFRKNLYAAINSATDELKRRLDRIEKYLNGLLSSNEGKNR